MKLKLIWVLIFLLIQVIFSLPVSANHELTQALQCVRLFHHFETKYNIPRDLLYSISLYETGKFNKELNVKLPWPWAVNVAGIGFYFDTKVQAVKFVKQKLKEGVRSIDVGCMQINLKHHPQAFRSIENSFDPRANIEYGALFLRSKYDQAKHWPQAISNYHSMTAKLGSKYYNGVITLAKNIHHHKSPFKKSVRQLYAQNTPYFKNRSRERYRSNMMVYVPSSKTRVRP